MLSSSPRIALLGSLALPLTETTLYHENLHMAGSGWVAWGISNAVGRPTQYKIVGCLIIQCPGQLCADITHWINDTATGNLCFPISVRHLLGSPRNRKSHLPFAALSHR